MSKKQIVAGAKLTEHFREKVQTAIAEQGLKASEMTEYYLVNLLKEFHKSEKLFHQEGAENIEKPLALLLFEAMKGDIATKTRCLKKLGDTALYLSSFFAENLEKRLVGKRYYASMGGAAYASLACMLENEKAFGELYFELAHKFQQFVHVLAEVSPCEHVHNNADLLRIYERWLRSGDNRLAQVLQRQGFSLETISIKAQ
jgi:hypothetical protein